MIGQSKFILGFFCELKIRKLCSLVRYHSLILLCLKEAAKILVQEIMNT